MKIVINGKLYNTETATFLCSYDNGLSNSDFKQLYEELYRKKTGEFFLYGKGGPMTKYREEAGSRCWTWGEDIIPLSIKEAKEWAEAYMSVERYCSIFGIPEE